MHYDGSKTRVGRRRGAPQRCFSFALAFVVALFYSVVTMSELRIGLALNLDVETKIVTDGKVGQRYTSSDRSADCPSGVYRRNIGQAALADATDDPNIIARSAVDFDCRTGCQYCLPERIVMEQAGNVQAS